MFLQRLSNPRRRGSARYRFRKAHLIAASLLISSLLLSVTGYCQNITMNVRAAGLEKVFREIEKQSSYSFIYSQTQLKQAAPVNLEVKDERLENVLKLLFRNQPFTYSVSGRFIAIRAKGNRPDAGSKPGNHMTIHGKVLDEKGHPVPSVSVVIPGTPLGTMTGTNGEYTLANIPAYADIIFSYVGYEQQRFPIKGRDRIDIVLKAGIKGLDETVVIGYSTTTKRKNTGSVSSISNADISRQPVANPLNALQGRIPGAVVTQANGLPGSRVTIQIRGVNSLNNGQQPLYIIDGVPFNMIDQAVPATNDLNSNGFFAANSGISPFSVINPGDIERIDILKDADATAIYGTKAANGVVLITTKKGKAGKTRFDVNVYYGAGKVSRFIPMMNTEQYLQLRNDAFARDGLTPDAATAPDLLVWDKNKHTDWQKKYMGGTANTTDVQATISGGDSRNRFLFGTGYHRETTVFPGDFNDTRLSVRLNADHSSQDNRFNAGISANYAFNRSNLLGTDLSTIYNLPPNMPIHNDDGGLFWNSNFVNPESYLLQKYIGKTNNLLANSTLRYTIIPGLEAKVSLSFNKMTLNQNLQQPAISKSPIGATPTNSARFATVDQQAYTIEPQLNYGLNVSKGRLSLLVGSTWQSSVNSSNYITADNYSNPALLGTPAGAGNTTISATYTQYRYNSFFGRINYDWESKYIVNLNFRRDGSSRFGAENRFGNFGSVGAAWIFTNEDFISRALPFLSFGKLRASYGLTGNDQIQDYLYMTLFSTSSGTLAYQGSSILSPARINNPSLKWETNKKLGIGMDLAFLKDRLQLTVDYYRNRTGDQLGYLMLSSQAGFNAYSSNFDALIQNSGWEFDLNSINISGKDFEWKTTFNLTIPRTLLLKASPQYFSYNQFALGKPLSYVLGYTYKGVDPQTGAPMYQDFTKDSLTFTPGFNTDRRVIGYTAPEFYGGLNNTLRYRSVELSFFFQFTVQEGNILPSSAPGVLSNGNQATLWLDRWKRPGDITSLPRATTTSSLYAGYSGSDATWGDASFARLRNVMLAYTLDERWIRKLKISALRIYVQGQNLFTWTRNKYVSDPETIATINQSPVVMPPLRVITAGINCSF